MELSKKEIREKHLNDIKTKLEYTKTAKRVIAEKDSLIPDDYIMDMEELIEIIEEQNQEIEYYKDELELETSSWKKIEKAENLISKDKIRDKIDEYRQLREYIIKSSKDLQQIIKNIPDFERIDFCIGMLEDLLEDKGENKNGK